MNIVALKFHPVAELFPLLEGAEFRAFQQDLAANGQQETIKLLEGQILDGRNRYRACLALGREPRTEELPPGTDPLRYVVSLNLHRRHLSTAQRGLIAARIANTKNGDNRYSLGSRIRLPSIDESVKVTESQAAEMLDVSHNTIHHAKRVLRNGVPELVDLVAREEVPLYVATRVTKLPPDEQAALAKNGAAAVKAKLGGRAAKHKAPPRYREADVAKLVEGVKPILKELKMWGRQHPGMMSPSAIKVLAVQLERLFEPFGL